MKRKLKLGIRAKVVIPILVINLISFGIMSMVVDKSVQKNLKKLGSESALSIARYTASLVDQEALHNVAKNQKRDDDYWSIFNVLDNVIKNSNIEYAYIIGKVDNEYRYLVDTTDTDETAFALEEERYLAETKQAFESDGYCTKEIDQSEYGILLSAAVPIKEADGTVSAILQVDFDASGIQRSINRIRIITSCTGILMSIEVILIIMYILSKVLRSVKSINDKLVEITSNHGDLTHRIKVDTNDEIGTIGHRFNEMLEYIQGTVKNISNVTDKIRVFSDNLRQSTNESAIEIENVSSIMEEMSAMMQQTNTSMEQIALTISEMKEYTNEIFGQVSQGQQVSNDILAEAQQIFDQAQLESANVKNVTVELTDNLNRRIEESRTVEKIRVLSERILDITEETRLLALNASIEAARAGEAGRGFTVVAEQITHLSNTSAETAKEIQEISEIVIQSVKELALESDKMLQFVSDKTIGGFEQLLEVGEHYKTNANNVNNMYHLLKEKVNQLEEGMRGINQATNEVNAAVIENTNGITQTAESATQLKQIIQDNNSLAEDNLQLTDKLIIEVDKFIC